MRQFLLAPCIALACAALALPAAAQAPAAVHDEFFWLSEINKASWLTNTDQGLLAPDVAPRVAAALSQVIAQGDQPGGKRPVNVITYEPLLIQAGGPEVTLLHAGRSSQDMLATTRAAMLRDDMLGLAEQLNRTTRDLVEMAAKQRDTIVPNYTNGVAAQPNSLGHALLGHAAGLDRDAQRLREAYARIDRSPMGTTVLNGTSWPLDRARMAAYLGFPALVENAFDAAQVSPVDAAVETGALVSSIGLHTGAFVQDLMVQYAGPRPWILLADRGGATYVSSAMPQKHNPGLLNSTRRDASTAVDLSLGPVMRAHNLPPGMSDAKEVRDGAALVRSGVTALQGWQKILDAMVVDPQRALDALNSDWTASQEIADTLMRKWGVPFRVGHHFASELVDYARAHDIRPPDFPYAQARRIYREALAPAPGAELPMSEAEFRAALDPVAIVRARATAGGPQPAEMDRMLAAARQRIAAQDAWIAAERQRIATALATLDTAFAQRAPHR